MQIYKTIGLERDDRVLSYLNPTGKCQFVLSPFFLPLYQQKKEGQLASYSHVQSTWTLIKARKKVMKCLCLIVNFLFFIFCRVVVRGKFSKGEEDCIVNVNNKGHLA